MAETKVASAQGRRAGRAAAHKLSGVSSSRVRHALKVLSAKGVLGRSALKKVSVRVDPGLLEARAKMSVDNDTDLLTAALALAAVGRAFGRDLRRHGRLF